MTGSGTLTIKQSEGSALVLGEESEVEVGPVTIKGADDGKAGFENGSVELLGGELDSRAPWNWNTSPSSVTAKSVR